jgi:redox-sensitive bicupin YhaK (pirin superfamily)
LAAKEQTMTTTTTSWTVRPADARGRTELRWLHGRHSFSFGRYYDPNNLGYRSLRVINDDIIEPASGFGEHGHDNMEILTWVLEGALHHQDSTGSDGELRPGELQAMTAGRGIRHSEVNDSPTERVHLLQIWIEPDTVGLPPSYGQKAFARDGRLGKWQTLASPDGRNESMRIHQDAVLSVTDLRPGQQIDLQSAANRHAYVHVAYGTVRVGETRLNSGDAITFAGPESLTFAASEESQVLYFDLA